MSKTSDLQTRIKALFDPDTIDSKFDPNPNILIIGDDADETLYIKKALEQFYEKVRKTNATISRVNNPTNGRLGSRGTVLLLNYNERVAKAIRRFDNSIPILPAPGAEEVASVTYTEIGFDVPGRKYSTIGIGGKVEVALKPTRMESLQGIVQQLYREKIPFDVIGNGSNTILGNVKVLVDTRGSTRIREILVGDSIGDFRDGEINYLSGTQRHDIKAWIARQYLKDEKEREKTKSFKGLPIHVEIEAGASNVSLARKFSPDYGLTGLERLAGIPGCIGGSVAMNAASGLDAMSDIVLYARTIGPDGEFHLLTLDDLGFKHRYSELQRGGEYEGHIVYAVGLKLHAEDKAVIRSRINAEKKLRAEEPKAGSSIGSFWIRRGYKRQRRTKEGRYEEDPAHSGGTYTVNELLGKARTKGLDLTSSSGNVYVPEDRQRATFLVAKKGATFYDVVELARRIYLYVRDEFNVLLRKEGKLLGMTEYNKPLDKVAWSIITGETALEPYAKEFRTYKKFSGGRR